MFEFINKKPDDNMKKKMFMSLWLVKPKNFIWIKYLVNR